MKRTLFITGITTLALAVGAMGEDQPNQRAKAKGANRAAAATSTRANTGGNARGRQFTAQQNKQNRQVTTHQNKSTRAFNRQAGIKTQTSTQANVGANRVTTRERNLRRAQTTTSNAVVNNTTDGRVTRQQALREQRAQQRLVNGTTTNRDVTINRTRNVNRNVTVVNDWRSSQFAGQRYSAFRGYHRSWHNRDWYHSHYGTSLVFVLGAPYFWNSGYWYPAWGYNPGYVYPYDGPIYGASTLAPDQIVMNVQAQLRDDGYYNGAIDGVLGPQTRYALAQFQADHGLAVTSAVDEPTLATLGLA
jgi:hypothetical protein